MSDRPSLEEVFQRIVEVITADFSDIAVDVQLRYTPSGRYRASQNILVLPHVKTSIFHIFFAIL